MQIEEVDDWLNCRPISNYIEPNSVQELVSRDIINKGINDVKELMEFKNNDLNRLKDLVTKAEGSNEDLHKVLMAAGGTVNSDKTEDDLWEDSLNDKNESSIDLTNKAVPRARYYEYLQWKDNLAEMKMFCLDDCNITYEYAPGIDCFWNLSVKDCFKDKWVNVALNDYVIKVDDGFIVLNSYTFNKYFII